MSAERDYLKWRRKPAVGCMFARYLAARYGDFPQRIVSIATGRGPERAAADIAAQITTFVDDVGVSAATLLFPGLRSLEETACVMLELKNHVHWTATTAMLQPPPDGEMVTVHIARQIPFGQATCPSEVLVLGPFPEFPSTRRAPVAAMEIYVGKPFDNDPKTGAPTTKANLAHFDIEALPPNTFDKMWDKSIKGREASLGGADNRAKAKVSMVVPLAMARRLGCMP